MDQIEVYRMRRQISGNYYNISEDIHDTISRL